MVRGARGGILLLPLVIVMARQIAPGHCTGFEALRNYPIEWEKGINSTHFLQNKKDSEEIISVKQHFESVAQHFQSVALHFEQHFESVEQHFQQHFQQHFRSVAQHFETMATGLLNSSNKSVA